MCLIAEPLWLIRRRIQVAQRRSSIRSSDDSDEYELDGDLSDDDDYDDDDDDADADWECDYSR